MISRDLAWVSGRGVLLLGDELGQAADDVEGIAGFVGQAGGGQVQFFEVQIQFAGPNEAELQFGGLVQAAPGQAIARHGNRPQ